MNPPELDIWILAGQSNMQGCGLLQGALEPDERVWNFTSGGNWEIGCEPLHRLWESVTPVHQNLMRAGMSEEDLARDDAYYAAQDDAARVGGSGLGLAFGRAMAEATGRPVGVISAAHGGTSLAQWDHTRRDEGGASLYGAMIERVRRALENGGTLRGLLWYQGESDANPADAASYPARFKAWIEAARADLGRPDLPVLAVQIGRVTFEPGQEISNDQVTGWNGVQQALLELPQQVPNTAVTATVDLGLTDTIHIDTPGLIRLGKRLARLALGKSSPRVIRLENATTPHGMAAARFICEGVEGGWNPRQHISGFQVYRADGSQHPKTYVINAEADSENPANIRLLLSAPLDSDTRIGYGLGLAPYCNAVDDADMPMCVFAPIAVNG